MAEFVHQVSRSGDADGPLELARRLVATPSVNPALEASGTGEKAVAALAGGWLQDWGFDVSVVDEDGGRPSVVARRDGTSGRSLILSGHLDTVGVEGMTIAPFDPVVRDGRLWGRGAADMKGGLGAALAAARDLAAADPAGTLIVALTADEEEQARGCQRLLDDGLRADAAIVCEPTGLAIMPAHKGFAWVQVDFRGQAAHGSRPERGVDSIRHAGLFLARLDELEAALARRKKHPLLGSGSIHAGTIHGGTAPSIYPSSCRLTLERRTLPSESASAIRSEIEFVLAQLRSDVPSLDASVEVTLYRGGTEVSGDHALVEALSGALAEEGMEARVAGMTAWVEAALYNAAGVPAVCFGPGRIENAHTSDEWAATEEIRAAHRVLREAGRRLLS